jgi:hypothetical protein
MKKTLFLSGLLSTALLTACAGDDGKQTASDATTNPTGATATDSASSTSGGTDTDPTTSGSTSGSTSAGTGSSTSGAETDTDTGCTFLDCGTTGTPSTECDIWGNDCPDGQKCMPWANDGGSSWNATKCSPLDAEPGKPGDPCTVDGGGVSGIDNCEAGSMCWNVDGETMMGYCIGFCDGTPESYTCAEQGTSCSILNNGVLILCLPNCDPLLQDCDGGDLCLWGGEAFICALDASGEEGQYGDPCEFANVCDPGLICLNPEYVPDCMAGGCCSPWCDINDFDCPGEGQDCLPWFEDGQAPPGFDNVGICGIPQ